MSEVKLGTIYDFNKVLSRKEKTMDAIEINKTLLDVCLDLSPKSTYCMLLCHDLRDYTIFNLKATVNVATYFKQELQETLFNRGAIVSIAKTEDNQAWEIWIRQDDSDYCYYLFNYDAGVVEVIG